MELNEEYWDNRYKTNEIGWDLGQVSPPLKAYIDQLTNKEIKILIPGGGNSYEAEYLHEKGFKNVYVVDVSKTALNNIQNRIPDYPKSHLIHDNFFNLDLTFDLIIEQTFFCALNPSLRPAYAVKTHELLSENGKLVGLLFKIPLNDSHPPFGGSKEEYLNYFQPYFQINTMEESYNSIEARSGKELFMILQK
ncbi:thiopurine S-methyltransferase [Oceanihabitans sediminis]|uniref:Methyltransferase domain-containing protein n=1 Tax=Oceanihabitans sediminis TaxID=1812012 RepID=A0A368P4W2_9FLAO|nr:methyltransferase domain-containing protein [Oceanihabitans sediminis]RBP32963.1 thiopurine S-methyltransferase [Oceanihabitans sediminis]RCU57518.1 methyltransferase domain-containing protein [Oceanihabitans sediminis]